MALRWSSSEICACRQSLRYLFWALLPISLKACAQVHNDSANNLDIIVMQEKARRQVAREQWTALLHGDAVLPLKKSRQIFPHSVRWLSENQAGCHCVLRSGSAMMSRNTFLRDMLWMCPADTGEWNLPCSACALGILHPVWDQPYWSRSANSCCDENLHT